MYEVCGNLYVSVRKSCRLEKRRLFFFERVVFVRVIYVEIVIVLLVLWLSLYYICKIRFDDFLRILYFEDFVLFDILREYVKYYFWEFFYNYVLLGIF